MIKNNTSKAGKALTLFKESSIRMKRDKPSKNKRTFRTWDWLVIIASINAITKKKVGLMALVSRAPVKIFFALKRL